MSNIFIFPFYGSLKNIKVNRKVFEDDAKQSLQGLQGVNKANREKKVLSAMKGCICKERIQIFNSVKNYSIGWRE